jgi:hypothetical protein
MHPGPSRRLFFPALAGLLLLAGCATSPNDPGPPPLGPPPMPAETIPLPPVTEENLIWQPGYWEWNGARYTWRAGRYVPRGEHSNQWMPGFWALDGGRWNWVPAHWL